MSDTPTVVPLPGGASAVLWDAETIPAGRRRPLITAVGDGSALEGGDLGRGYEVMEIAVRAMVRSWTLTGPDGTALPTPWEQGDVLDELPGGGAVLDALVGAVLPRIESLVPRLDLPKSPGSSTTPATAG